MNLPLFRYRRPPSMEEALKELATGNAVALGGGTDILVAMKRGLARPETVVDVRGIDELGVLSVEDGALRIGAHVTLARLERAAVVRRGWPGLAEAVRLVASPLLRNLGTVGGNLLLPTRCRYYNQSSAWQQVYERCYRAGGARCRVTGEEGRCRATYCGDLAPVLLVMGAEVRIRTLHEDRWVPLASIYTGDGRNPVRLAEESPALLAEVRVPAVSGSVTYRKWRRRAALEYPEVGVAAWLCLEADGTCLEAGLSFTGMGSGPVTAREAARRLVGHGPNPVVCREIAREAVAATSPVNTGFVSPRYKRHLATAMAEQALAELAKLGEVTGIES